MAVQNVGARAVFADLAPTTMVTGNVTQVAIDLVDLMIVRGRPDSLLKARIRKTWPPVAAFALGAIGGAIGLWLTGPWSLLAAAAAVALLAVPHAVRR